MASMADAIHGVDVFGQRNTVAIPLDSPGVDVLARLSRSIAPDFDPAPKSQTVRIIVGGRPIDFPYTTGDRGLPSWAEPVFKSLASNWGAQPGWDSYKAVPTDPRLAVQLLNILSAVMADSSHPPQMMPLADGGLQAEWHGACDLEIVVPSDGPPRYYFFDRDTSDEEEDNLNESRIRELIGKLE